MAEPAQPLASPARAALIAFVEAMARNQARLDAIEAGEASLEDFNERPAGSHLRQIFNRAAK